MSAAAHAPSADQRARARLVPPTLKPLPRGTGQWKLIAALLRNPISMYTERHFEEPMVHGKYGRQTMAQVMDPDLVQQVCQGDEFGRSIFLQRLLGPALRQGLLTAEGEKWRRQRRAASPAFRQRALDALVPTIDTAAQEMVGRMIRGAGTVQDMHPEMIRVTFDIIMGTLLQGDDTEYPQAQISEDVDALLQSIGSLSVADIFPILTRIAPRRLFVRGYRQGTEALGRLRGLAEDIVQKRMETPDDRDDLMGQLIRAQDPKTGDRLTPQELVDNALTFVGAGHETTALALTWTLYILAMSRSTQDALAAEAIDVLGDGPVTAEAIPKLALHDRVIKESMRLFPPVPIFGRTVLAPTEVGGLSLKIGDSVAVPAYAIHRHTALWDDPNAFDPDRFLPEAEAARHRFAFVPFGGGPRICIGLRFAMMEAVTILAHMMRQITVRGPANLAAEPYLTVTMRPKDGMPLVVEKR